MAHTLGTFKWYKFMALSHNQCVYICGTYIWCIPMGHTFIAHTYAKYFRYLNVKYTILCCTHVLHLVYAVSILHCICGGIFMLSLPLDMWLIMWLYMFPYVFSYHYLHNCLLGFSCSQLKGIINIPQNCPIVYHMEWSTMCVLWGFHTCSYSICR